MNKLYINRKHGLYTEFEVPPDEEVSVPLGWEEFFDTWEETQDEGLVFMGHHQAGFTTFPAGGYGEISH